ncbi:MAG: hypothetical protein LUQ50_03815, partial [Methanospirillum sp.]|uniref:hypothetical protein n=1 Tax=Methanospirillum sp. TaxID=45200 RepID=UPI00237183BC
MSSFFGKPENIRIFFKDFDLLGDQSESAFFIDLCAETESLDIYNPQNFPWFAALESLLTALGDHRKARDLITGNMLIREDMIFRLRFAAHSVAMGIPSDAEEELRNIRNEKHRDLIGKLGEILSAGRLNEHEEVKNLWESL